MAGAHPHASQARVTRDRCTNATTKNNRVIGQGITEKLESKFYSNTQGGLGISSDQNCEVSKLLNREL